MQRSSCLLLFVSVCCAASLTVAAPSGEVAAPSEQGAAASSIQSLDLLSVEKERSDDAHEEPTSRQARQILGVYPYGGYGYGYLGGYRPFYSSYYPYYNYYYPRYYGGYYPSYRYSYGFPSYFYG